MTNIPAEELIKLLEEKDLVAPEVLADIREQVAQSRRGPKPIYAAALAKTLVDKGYLSRLLAQRLMAKLEAEWAQKSHRQKPDPLLLKPLSPPSGPSEEELQLADEEPVIDLIPTEDDKPVPPPISRKPPPSQSPAQSEIQPIESPAVTREGAHVEDLLSELAPATGAASTPAPPSTVWEKRRKSPWESPLFLFGSGILLILVFVGVVLLWSLNRRSGDELLAEADADFHSGSYTQAVYKYGKFLEDFPQHPQAGLAQVRKGLATIRQAMESSDPVTAFQTVKRIIPELAVLPDFHAEADAEMTAILPGLAQRIAQQAYEKQDPSLVSVAEEILSFSNRYIPREQLPTAKLADIQATLELAKRGISEKGALASTIKQLAECRANGRLDEAYQIFEKFAREYPRSKDDPQLQKAMSELAEAEKDRVQFEPAQPTEAPTSSTLPIRELTLYSSWVGGPAPLSDNIILTLDDQESVYGLQAVTGKVLWQRSVGGFLTDNVSSSYPRVAVDGEETVAMPDPLRQAVVLVALTTGHVKRVISLGEPPASWVMSERSHLLVLGRSGKLHILNPVEGQRIGCFRFPQSPAYPPTIDPVSRRAFILGEHSHLFTIRLDSRECERVDYLAHERGQLCAPPALVSGNLVIPERRGNTGGRLRIIDVQTNTTDGFRVIQTIDLPHPVASPIQVLGTRFVIITTDGQLQVYQLRGGSDKQPFGLLAEGKTPDPSLSQKDWAIPRFVLFHKDQIIAADTALTQFALQASAGKLVPQWVACQETLAVSSPMAQDSVLIYPHRYPDRPGMFLTAVDAESGRVFWESQAADPPLTEARVVENGQTIQVLGQSGCVYQINSAMNSPSVAGIRPERVLRFPAIPEGNTPSGCVLPSNMWIVGTRGNRELIVLQPEQDRVQVRAVNLPRALSSNPVAFGNRVLIGLEDGSLVNLDVTTQQPVGQPYQCEVAPGESITWADVLPLDDKTVLAANSSGWLLKLRWVDQPDGHFQAEQSRLFDSAIVSSLSVVLDKIIAIDAKINALAISLNDLTTVATQRLSAHVVWGPIPVGNTACFATADGNFVLSSPTLEFTKLNLEKEVPIGRPLIVGNSLLLTTRQGSVLCVDPAQGTVLRRTNLHAALATGPTAIGEDIVLGSLDGRWFIVPKTEVLHGPSKN